MRQGILWSSCQRTRMGTTEINFESQMKVTVCSTSTSTPVPILSQVDPHPLRLKGSSSFCRPLLPPSAQIYRANSLSSHCWRYSWKIQRGNSFRLSCLRSANRSYRSTLVIPLNLLFVLSIQDIQPIRWIDTIFLLQGSYVLEVFLGYLKRYEGSYDCIFPLQRLEEYNSNVRQAKWSLLLPSSNIHFCLQTLLWTFVSPFLSCNVPSILSGTPNSLFCQLLRITRDVNL